MEYAQKPVHTDQDVKQINPKLSYASVASKKRKAFHTLTITPTQDSPRIPFEKPKTYRRRGKRTTKVPPPKIPQPLQTVPVTENHQPEVVTFKVRYNQLLKKLPLMQLEVTNLPTDEDEPLSDIFCHKSPRILDFTRLIPCPNILYERTMKDRVLVFPQQSEDTKWAFEQYSTATCPLHLALLIIDSMNDNPDHRLWYKKRVNELGSLNAYITHLMGMKQYSRFDMTGFLAALVRYAYCFCNVADLSDAITRPPLYSELEDWTMYHDEDPADVVWTYLCRFFPKNVKLDLESEMSTYMEKPTFTQELGYDEVDYSDDEDDVHVDIAVPQSVPEGTGPTEQVENVTFINNREVTLDEAQVTGPSNPLKTVSDIPWDVRSMMNRPIRLTSYNWNVGQVGEIGSFVVPNQTLVPFSWHDNICKMFGFGKFDVEIRFVLNSSKFHNGQAICAFIPMPVSDQDTNDEYYLSALPAFPHVMLDASISNTGVIRIPFASIYTIFALHESSFYQTLGSLRVFVFNQLRAAEGASQTVTITAFVSYPNAELNQTFTLSEVNIRAAGPPEAEPQSVEALLKDLGGAVKDGFGGLATISKGMGETSSAAFKAGSGVSRFLNLDKPINPTPSRGIINQTASCLAHGVGLDRAQRLALNPDSMTMTTAATLATRDDDMDLKTLLTTKTRVGTFNWGNGDAPGAILLSREINPCMTEFTSAPYFNMLAYITRAFNLCRGDIDVTFQFLATLQHTGRVVIGFAPGATIDQVTSDNYSDFIYKVCDLQEEHTFTLRIPFFAPKPWIRTGLNNFSRDPILAPCESYGVLFVIVANNLTTPNNVSTSIDANLMIAGADNFEVAIVNDLKGIIGYGVNNASPFDNAKPQSDQIVDRSTESTEDAGRTRVPLEHPALTIGESFMDLKDILRRYYPAFFARFEVEPKTTSYLTFPASPFIGYGNYQSTDGDLRMFYNILSHFGNLFTFYRGSTRFQILFGQNNSNHITCRIYFLPGIFYPISPTVFVADETIAARFQSYGTLLFNSHTQNSANVETPFYTQFGQLIIRPDFTTTPFNPGNSTGSLVVLFENLGDAPVEMTANVNVSLGDDAVLNYRRAPPRLNYNDEENNPFYRRVVYRPRLRQALPTATPQMLSTLATGVGLGFSVYSGYRTHKLLTQVEAILPTAQNVLASTGDLTETLTEGANGILPDVKASVFNVKEATELISNSSKYFHDIASSFPDTVSEKAKEIYGLATSGAGFITGKLVGFLDLARDIYLLLTDEFTWTKFIINSCLLVRHLLQQFPQYVDKVIEDVTTFVTQQAASTQVRAEGPQPQADAAIGEDFIMKTLVFTFVSCCAVCMGKTIATTTLYDKVMTGLKDCNIIGRGLTGLDVISTKLQGIFSWITDWFYGTDNPEYLAKIAIDSQLDSLVAWAEEIRCLEVIMPTQQITTSADLRLRCTKVHDTTVEMEALLIKGGLPSRVSGMINSLCKRARLIYDHAMSLRAADNFRVDPFCFQLFGKPRSGKSLLLTPLCDEICDFMELPKTGRHYTRNCADKYVSNYVGQICYKSDDWAQIVNGTDMEEFISQRSNNELKLNMADVSQKGTPFISQILANASNQSHPVSNNVRSKEAVWERRHILTEVRPKKPVEFKGYIDKDNVEFRLMDPKNANVYLSGWMDYKPFVNILCISARDWLCNQHQMVSEHNHTIPTLNLAALRAKKEPYPTPQPDSTTTTPKVATATPQIGIHINPSLAPNPVIDPQPSFMERVRNKENGWWCVDVANSSKFDLPTSSFEHFQFVEGHWKPKDDDESQIIAGDVYNFWTTMKTTWAKQEKTQNFWWNTETFDDYVAKHFTWTYLGRAKTLGQELLDTITEWGKNLYEWVCAHPLYSFSIAVGASLLAAVLYSKCLAPTTGLAESAYNVADIRAPSAMRVVPQGTCDINAFNLTNERVIPYLFKARVPTTDGKGLPFNIFALDGRVVLAPFHCLEIAKRLGYLEVEKDGLFKTYDVTACDAVRIEGKDTCLLTMPKSWQQFRSSVNLFLKNEDLPHVEKCRAELCIIRNRPCTIDLTAEANRAVQYTSTLVGETFYTTNSWRYSAQTVNGDCGAILCLYNSKLVRKLAGIHVAGIVDESVGYSELITQEMLTNAMTALNQKTCVNGTPKPQCESFDPKFKPEAGIGIIGRVPNGLMTSSPTKTKIKKSTIHGKVEKAVKYPAILSTQDPRNPEHISPHANGVNKYAGNVMPLPTALMDEVEASFDDDIAMMHGTYEVLDLKTTIQGRAGVDFMDRINMASSAGYPYCVRKNKGEGKKALIDADTGTIIDPELQKKFDERLENAKRGERVESVWVDCLKDELRPAHKIASVSTRVFTIPPVDFTLLVRMYLLSFCAAFYNSRLTTFSCVGMNPYSGQTKRMYDEEKARSAYGIGGDFKAFDAIARAELYERVCNIILKWIRTHSNLTPEEFEEVKRIIITIFDEIIHTVQTSKDCFYMTDHGNKSGSPLTVITNTIALEFLMRMGWKGTYAMAKVKQPTPPSIIFNTLSAYRKHVLSRCYGDDVKQAITVEALKFYNQDTLSEWFAQFGITFTDESKLGITAFKRIEDITFLKNAIRLDDKYPNLVFAALDPTSIYELTNWIRESPSDERATIENCETALRFAYFHGEVFFNNLKSKIVTALPPGQTFPTWNDLHYYFTTGASVVTDFKLWREDAPEAKPQSSEDAVSMQRWHVNVLANGMTPPPC